MAATDLNTVRSTIEARLVTELASTPPVTVLFNNMAFDSTTKDRVVISNVEFKIIQVITNEQNNTAVSFDLILR